MRSPRQVVLSASRKSAPAFKAAHPHPVPCHRIGSGPDRPNASDDHLIVWPCRSTIDQYLCPYATRPSGAGSGSRLQSDCYHAARASVGKGDRTRRAEGDWLKRLEARGALFLRADGEVVRLDRRIRATCHGPMSKLIRFPDIKRFCWRNRGVLAQDASGFSCFCWHA